MKWSARGRFDAHIQAAIQHLAIHQPKWEIQDVLRLVERGIPGTPFQGIGGVLHRLRSTARGWELDAILRDHAVERARAYMKQTVSVKMKGEQDPVELRLYEAYKDTHGSYLWQRVTSMTRVELQVCVQQRRLRMAGEARRIAVYEELIQLLGQYGDQATVGQIYDKVFEESA